jgi:allantoinase
MCPVHGADLLIRSRRVVTPDGIREACLHVEDGRIARVAAFDDVPAGLQAVEAGDLAILPGLVDTHVHVNEPGRTEWEGFASATRAAAAGGVTTIVDMPLNSVPPTTTPEALARKRRAAEGACHVDVGFWGGAVPESLGHLGELHAEGVFGFKAFLCDSGVEEFPSLDLAHLRSAMEEAAALDALLLVHAELPEVLAEAAGGLDGADPGAYLTYLASRPDEAEERAVELVVEEASRTGCRVHVLHVSSADSLGALDGAGGVTAETCPHYLTLAAEEIGPGRLEFKCAPPIREAANRERLWGGLRAGALGAVVSDHSPCTPELKSGSFFEAWGGIASLQLGLRAVWTGARRRDLGLEDLARWMSEGPARIAGLRTKGAIEAGRDADLVLFDPGHSAACDPGELHHRHPVTPYAGHLLDGRIAATYLRGVRVYADDDGFLDRPAGRLLERGSA